MATELITIKATPKNLLRKQDISKVISQEITWHRKHPGGSGCGESFENGFIVGLQQARRLIRQMKGEDW